MAIRPPPQMMFCAYFYYSRTRRLAASSFLIIGRPPLFIMTLTLFDAFPLLQRHSRLRRDDDAGRASYCQLPFYSHAMYHVAPTSTLSCFMADKASTAEYFATPFSIFDISHAASPAAPPLLSLEYVAGIARRHLRWNSPRFPDAVANGFRCAPGNDIAYFA